MQTQAASQSQSSLIREHEFQVCVSREFAQFCISVNTRGARKRGRAGDKPHNEAGYSCRPFSCVYQVISRDLVTRYRLLCRPDNGNPNRAIVLVPGGGDGLCHKQMTDILRSAVLQLKFDCGQCGIATLDENTVSVKALPYPAERHDVILAVRQSLGLTLRANDWLQFARADGFVSSDITAATRDTVSREHVADVFRLAVDFREDSCFIRVKPSRIRTFGIDETMERTGVGTMVNVLPNLTPAKLIAVSTPTDQERECLRVFWLNKYGFRLPERFLVANVCFRRIQKPLAYPLCCLVTQPGEVKCEEEEAQCIGAEVIDIFKSMQLFDPGSRGFVQLFDDLHASNASAVDGDSDRSSVMSGLSQESTPNSTPPSSDEASAKSVRSRSPPCVTREFAESLPDSALITSNSDVPKSMMRESISEKSSSPVPSGQKPRFVLTSGLNVSKNPKLMTREGALCIPQGTNPKSSTQNASRKSVHNQNSGSARSSLPGSRQSSGECVSPNFGTFILTSASNIRKNPALTTAPPSGMEKATGAIISSGASASSGGAFVLTSAFNISKNPGLTKAPPSSVSPRSAGTSKNAPLSRQSNDGSATTGLSEICQTVDTSKSNSCGFILTSALSVSKNPSLTKGPPTNMTLKSTTTRGGKDCQVVKSSRKTSAKNLLCAPGASTNILCAAKDTAKPTTTSSKSMRSASVTSTNACQPKGSQTSSHVSKSKKNFQNFAKLRNKNPAATRLPVNSSALFQNNASVSSTNRHLPGKTPKPSIPSHSTGPLSSLTLNQSAHHVSKPPHIAVAKCPKMQQQTVPPNRRHQSKSVRSSTASNSVATTKRQKVQRTQPPVMRHSTNTVAALPSIASRYGLPSKQQQQQQQHQHVARVSQPNHPNSYIQAGKMTKSVRGLPTITHVHTNTCTFTQSTPQINRMSGNSLPPCATSTLKRTYSAKLSDDKQQDPKKRSVYNGDNVACAPPLGKENIDYEQSLESLFAVRKISKRCLTICLEQEVDVSVLQETTVDEMKELGIAFGDRKKILRWQREVCGV